jgi:hypothetical protein
MSTRSGLAVLVLVLTAVTYSPPPSPAAQSDISPSGFVGADLPFAATVRPPSGFPDRSVPDRDMSLPFAFGVRFTAWWNDLTDTSALEFRSDVAAPQVFPSVRPPVRQRFTAESAEFHSARFAVNLLAQRPFGFSDTFPEGRWSPYLGIGTGAQVSPIKVSLLSDMDTSLIPTLQVVTGVQFLLTRSFALFGEYRFSPLDHPFALQTDRETLAPGANRLIGGFALHF